MKFRDLKRLKRIDFYKRHGGLPILLPFMGYIVFGLITIYLLSFAIKQLPAAVAFAVWMASTLILIKIAELVFFKQRISVAEIFFMLLIIVGILGLKIYAVPAK